MRSSAVRRNKLHYPISFRRAYYVSKGDGKKIMEGLSDIKRVQDEILLRISELKVKLDNEVKERLDIVDDIYKTVDRIEYEIDEYNGKGYETPDAK